MTETSRFLIRDGVGARGQVIHLDFPGAGGVDHSVDAIPGDGDRDAQHIAILGDRNDLHAAQADFHLDKTPDGGGDRLRLGHEILDGAVRPGVAVRPGDDAPALGVVLAGGDGDGAVCRCFHADGRHLPPVPSVRTGKCSCPLC